MIPVCKDTENNGDTSLWFYDQGTYSRRDAKGTIKAYIKGENLPNPVQLWQARCAENGAEYPRENIPHTVTGQIIRLKPTEATFRLFEHWQGAQQAHG